MGHRISGDEEATYGRAEVCQGEESPCPQITSVGRNLHLVNGRKKRRLTIKSKTKATSWVVTDTINLLAKFLLGLSGCFFPPYNVSAGVGA